MEEEINNIYLIEEKLECKIKKQIPVLDAIYDWNSQLISKYSIVDNTGIWSSMIKSANFDLEGKCGLKKLTIETFISYYREDEGLRKELDGHLSNLKRQGKIVVWHEEVIEPGVERKVEIKKRLESADLILLLISPGFMASEYCYEEQMQQAMELYEAGTAQVIPIILKPVHWEGTPFSKLQVLPKNRKPITTWNVRDEAFLDVVEGIHRLVESLR
ncbi:toll/interleukin-1 receptor domain-containing protein [Nostoc paludosum FACHB-159]|uniref:Toll/interleukin-1 receptor domain-containing protein n=2 Tax=Nostoc TaxID=1177 RepID=A0ABR8K5I8_9NOSO|nr:toll/interleukin-1 receptor domain-containing protein [Nostoc sp. FACHB-857]MBD2734041.1 toll/interleukin-1 receptor domain-containing protein [Nostoc paludosum FACHB-159]